MNLSKLFDSSLKEFVRRLCAILESAACATPCVRAGARSGYTVTLRCDSGDTLIQVTLGGKCPVSTLTIL